MSSRGVFAVSRSLFDHPTFKQEPYNEQLAWIWLIGEAAYKGKRAQTCCGRHRSIVELKRGQLSFSLRFMQKAWNWASEKKVRMFLKRLERDGLIVADVDVGQTVITICNYEKYQFPIQDPDAQTDAQNDAQRPRIGRKLKNDNNEKNEIERDRAGDPEGFVEWYAAYPRKVDRKAAARAFTKVIQGGNIDLQTLIERTKNFATQSIGTDQKFIKHPATWLNAGSYDNEMDAKTTPAISRDLDGITVAEWVKALRHHANSGGEWSTSHFGPPPGDAKCCVPHHLMHNDSRSCHERPVAS